MVGRDFTAFGGEEEEGVGFFARDFNIGLIARLGGIDGSFKGKIEFMAVGGGILDVIEDSLVRSGDGKDIFKDICGFSCGDAERDMKGKNEAQSIEGVSDIEYEFGFSRFGVRELVISEMIIPELIP